MDKRNKMAKKELTKAERRKNIGRKFKGLNKMGKSINKRKQKRKQKKSERKKERPTLEEEKRQEV